MLSTKGLPVGDVIRLFIASVVIVDLCESAWLDSERTTDVEENQKDVYIYNATYVEDDVTCGKPEVSVSPDFVTVTVQELNASPPTWTVMVKLVKELDAEVADTLVPFTLEAIPNCGVPNPLPKTLRVFIKIKDVKDTAPSFTQDHYIVNVSETAALGSLVVGNILATDTESDEDGFDTVTYTVNFSPVQQTLFNFTESAGVINVYLQGALDFETSRSHAFTVTATDSIGMNSTCDVTVNVENAFDSGPEFSLPVYFASIEENVPSGTPVTRVSAIDGDADSGSLGNAIRYSIVEGGAGIFRIDPVSGEVTTQGQLDAEHPYVDNGLVDLLIMAEEEISSGLAHQGETTAKVTLHVQIVDVDDNVPEFNADSFTGSIWEQAEPGDFISLSGPGFISLEDKDLKPTHNRFSIHLERDGQAWDVFSPSLDTAQGHVTIMLSLAQEGALDGMAGSEIYFQIVARAVSDISSSADVVLSVFNVQTSPLVTRAGEEQFSTAETVMIVLVIALLVFIILATAYLVYKRRSDKSPEIPVIRRNSKYYVSKRSNSNGQIPGADPGGRGTTTTDPEMDAGGVESRSGDEEETTPRSPTDVYETYVSERKRSDMTELPSTTESLLLESTSATGTLASANKHTVAGAADRNRCDVTLMVNKTHALVPSEQRLTSGESLGETVTQRSQVTPEERAQALTRSQDVLLSLLDTPGTSTNRCDVTSLDEVNATTASSESTGQGSESKHTSGYVNVGKGSLEPPGSTKKACDVAPLDQSLKVKGQALSELLEKVNQKLDEKKDHAEPANEKRCDVVPLSNSEKKENGIECPKLSSPGSQPESDSRKSSFSNTSVTDVAPLIKQGGKTKGGAKSSHLNVTTKMSKSSVQGKKNNPAFTGNSHEYPTSNDTVAGTNGKTPATGTAPSTLLNTHTISPCDENTMPDHGPFDQGNPSLTPPQSGNDNNKNNGPRGAFKLIKSSSPSTPTTKTNKSNPPPVAPKKTRGDLGSPPPGTPSKFQLSQPDVPPVALALPSFTASPALTEEYVVITNPVYEPYVPPAHNTSTQAVGPHNTQHATRSRDSVEEKSTGSDSLLNKYPSKDYMAKAKDLLSEVASSMMSKDRPENRLDTATMKSVRIVETQATPSPPPKSPERLTKF